MADLPNEEEPIRINLVQQADGSYTGIQSWVASDGLLYTKEVVGVPMYSGSEPLSASTQGSTETADNAIMNEPTLGETPMPSGYSDKEIDLKLENLEQRVDHKLDKVLFEVKEGFSTIETHLSSMEGKMSVLDAHIGWLRWFTGATFFLIIGILVTSAIKLLLR